MCALFSPENVRAGAFKGLNRVDGCKAQQLLKLVMVTCNLTLMISFLLGSCVYAFAVVLCFSLSHDN